MDFNQFRKELEEIMLEKAMDMPGSVQFKTVQKNGGPKHGIVFTPDGSSIGVTLYAEDGFKRLQEGKPVHRIAEEMAATMAAYSRDMEKGFNAEKLLVPENIFPALVPTKGNAGLLEEVPHFPFENLQVIFKFDLQNFEGGGTANVPNSYMEAHGWDVQKLMEIAMNNPIYRNQIKITPLEYAVSDLLDGADMGGLDNIKAYDLPMLVVSNFSGAYGAAAILDKDAMDRIANVFQDDLYILPSSIHECMVVPKSMQPLEELQEMVHEVNRMAVEPEIWLSDDVYQYDSFTRKITMAGIERERDTRQGQKQKVPEHKL